MTRTWSRPVTVAEMYGDWDYEAAVDVLERSLDPRPSTSLFDTIGDLGVGPDDTILDIGGRDGTHSLLIAERFGCHAVSVDPAEDNIGRGAELVAEHEFGHLVEVRRGAIEAIPADDDSFDVIFCRDVLAHVTDLDRGFAECARVLRPGGAMVIHAVFATDLLEPLEAEMLQAYAASLPERMSVPSFEASVEASAFTIADLEVIGSEWHESSQETGRAPNYLLQVSRLRRARDAMIEELGEVPYRAMYGNALWGSYHLLGKLESRVYVLRLDAV